MKHMDKPRKSLADYVAIVISPVLIMALVGSLVFFLLEVIYQGRYQGSLQHILFCFVFGAVLVSRMSMEAGTSDRAGLYGLVLGVVTWLALVRFVEYPEDSPMAPWGWAINIVLIGVIWWSAHRLTWDCTLIDDEVDASGTGLLQSAGLEKPADGAVADSKTDGEGNRKKTKDAEGLLGWMERYRRYRDKRRKQPHSPGVWVVYFSLAALPLFGLGQSQIPSGETPRRHYAFQLMCVYVGSGLGLLLTTSFLGLRRYLRQRTLRMPAGITTAWLSLGAFLIVIMLCLGALLPRPADPQPFFDWRFGSKDRDASRWAQAGDGKERRKDEEASQTEKGNQKDANQQSSNNGDKAGGKNGKGKASGKNKGNDKQQDGKRQDGKQEDGKQSDADKDKDQEKKDGSAGSKKDDDSKGRRRGGREEKEKAKSQGNKKDRTTKAQERAPSEPSGTFMKQAAAVVKWGVIGILVVLVVFFLLRSGLRFLANFTDWARRLLAAFQAWWQGLSGLWQRSGQARERSAAVKARVPPRPFSAYPDPFLTGRAEDMSASELVRYSFEALEAWAREHDLGRRGQETPGEFARRLGEALPAVQKGAHHLIAYYASVAYARAKLSDACRDPLRDLWLTLGDSVHSKRELMIHVDA
jgi:hypothetical protein